METTSVYIDHFRRCKQRWSKITPCFSLSLHNVCTEYNKQNIYIQINIIKMIKKRAQIENDVFRMPQGKKKKKKSTNQLHHLCNNMNCSAKRDEQTIRE